MTRTHPAGVAASRARSRTAAVARIHDDVGASTAFLSRIVGQFRLDLDGSHGVDHWLRVLDNGRRLAALTGADDGVLRWFALLHDCCRISNGSDPELRNALLKSLIRALALLGLKISPTRGRIERARDFDARSGWLYPRNINYVHITRMLRSLNLLGLEEEAGWLFQALTEIHATHGRYIGEAPMRFWRGAMGGRAQEGTPR